MLFRRPKRKINKIYVKEPKINIFLYTTKFEFYICWVICFSCFIDRNVAIFIYVVICIITAHDMVPLFCLDSAISLILTFSVFSIDILCELQVCWARIYGARNLLYFQNWHSGWTPYMLDTCLSGLRDTLSLLQVPWVYANWDRSLALRARFTNSLLRTGFANSPCRPLVIRFILNLLMGPIQIIIGDLDPFQNSISDY